jgi:dihydroflavonol-4-reductase
VNRDFKYLFSHLPPYPFAYQKNQSYLYKMVLITGATGSVGSHLAIHLVENDEIVRGIYRNENLIVKTKSLFELYKKLHLLDRMDSSRY